MKCQPPRVVISKFTCKTFCMLIRERQVSGVFAIIIPTSHVMKHFQETEFLQKVSDKKPCDEKTAKLTTYFWQPALISYILWDLKLW